jgi:hypothetical protein
MLFASASLRHEGSPSLVPTASGVTSPLLIGLEIIKTPGYGTIGTHVQSLKPRISYGVTGRSDLNAYQSTPTYTANGAYLMDGQWINGYAPLPMPIPN